MVKKADDVIVSTGVEKLNIISNNISPKKKKNSQNENKKYEVDLDVIVVKWNLYKLKLNIDLKKPLLV